MALVALDGTPLVPVGIGMPLGALALPTVVNTTQDATNEACIMYGQVFTDDGASHTIDTSGSSSIGWLCASATLANAGSTFKVGLAPLDTSAGPPARAVNSSDAITFDVSKSYTGGGAIPSVGWVESAPDTGTKTIANGDRIVLATQMTARAGADSILTACGGTSTSTGIGVTSFTGGAYAAVGAVPDAVITFSDGHLGFFFGGCVSSTPSTTQTWNNTSGTKEYGNYFLMPVPAKIYGIYVACTFAGDADVILYSDPLGTPVAEKTVSIDLNTIAAANARWNPFLFSSPYTTTASQPTASIVKPTSATNVGMPYKTFNASAHQKSETLGTNGYAVSRASGAFAAQNSNKDRFAIGLLVGAFDAGGGGAASMLVTSGMTGGMRG